MRDQFMTGGWACLTTSTVISIPVYCQFVVQSLPLDDRSVERGFGRTTTFNDWERTAMLEALERYAGMIPRGKRTIVQGSYSQLKEQAIHPPDLGIHDPQQANSNWQCWRVVPTAAWLSSCC